MPSGTVYALLRNYSPCSSCWKSQSVHHQVWEMHIRYFGRSHTSPSAFRLDNIFFCLLFYLYPVIIRQRPFIYNLITLSFPVHRLELDFTACNLNTFFFCHNCLLIRLKLDRHRRNTRHQQSLCSSLLSPPWRLSHPSRSAPPLIL